MMFNYSNLFIDLYNMPEQCIYGFINTTDKKIFIGFTTNIVTALYRNIKEMKYNHPCKEDINKLEFFIIETITDRKDLQVRYNYWVRDYSNKGYLMYRTLNNTLLYRVRVDLLPDFKNPSHRYLFYVKLVSRGYREVTVGVFDQVCDADSFVAINYSNVDKIVMADNQLTREFCGTN